jgi:hypothetical protein
MGVTPRFSMCTWLKPTFNPKVKLIVQEYYNGYF